MKHTVSQNGEFIARYCYVNDNDIYASAPLSASLLATSKFLSLSYLSLLTILLNCCVKVHD